MRIARSNVGRITRMWYLDCCMSIASPSLTSDPHGRPFLIIATGPQCRTNPDLDPKTFLQQPDSTHQPFRGTLISIDLKS